MAKLTQEDILAYLEEATILELNDLVSAIEDKFGVVAAAAVAAPAAGAAAATADTPYFSSIALTNSANSATVKASIFSNNSSIIF